MALDEAQVRVGLDRREGLIVKVQGLEKWRPVVGFRGYLVSNLGRVFSNLSDKCLKPQPSGSGHLRVALRRH
ncbi:hypothetical protein LCGC14_3115180, partial [marine sediment metagenome]